MKNASASCNVARCTRVPRTSCEKVITVNHLMSADVLTGAAGDVANAALTALFGCIQSRWSSLSWLDHISLPQPETVTLATVMLLRGAPPSAMPTRSDAKEHGKSA